MVRQNYPQGCPVGGKFFDKKRPIMPQKPQNTGASPPAGVAT
jgi:hypothetical protein